jgi:hypothetical protein
MDRLNLLNRGIATIVAARTIGGNIVDLRIVSTARELDYIFGMHDSKKTLNGRRSVKPSNLASLPTLLFCIVTTSRNSLHFLKDSRIGPNHKEATLKAKSRIVVCVLVLVACNVISGEKGTNPAVCWSSVCGSRERNSGSIAWPLSVQHRIKQIIHGMN